MCEERKTPMLAMVALLLTAVAVSTTNALRLVDPCDADQWKVTQSTVRTWVAGLMVDDKNISSVAKSVIHTCDTDGDATLDRSEFVACLEKDLRTMGISAGCYANLLGAAGTQEGEKMDAQALTRWVRLVTLGSFPQVIRKNENSRGNRRRDTTSNDPEGLRQEHPLQDDSFIILN